MPTLDDFHRSVQAALDSKRLGTPVFVRYLLQIPVASRAVPSFLAQVAHAVSGWLGQDLNRVYALGSVKARHVTLTLEFQGGASAQLTWVGVSSSGPGIDLMLVGNRGTLFHEGLIPAPGVTSSGLPAEAPPKTLLAWIERALTSGQPEGAER